MAFPKGNTRPWQNSHQARGLNKALRIWFRAWRSVRQIDLLDAATLLGINPADLSSWEVDSLELDEETTKRLYFIYRRTSLKRHVKRF